MFLCINIHSFLGIYSFSTFDGIWFEYSYRGTDPNTLLGSTEILYSLLVQTITLWNPPNLGFQASSDATTCPSPKWFGPGNITICWPYGVSSTQVESLPSCTQQSPRYHPHRVELSRQHLRCTQDLFLWLTTRTRFLELGREFQVPWLIAKVLNRTLWMDYLCLLYAVGL